MAKIYIHVCNCHLHSFEERTLNHYDVRLMYGLDTYGLHSLGSYFDEHHVLDTLG